MRQQALAMLPQATVHVTTAINTTTLLLLLVVVLPLVLNTSCQADAAISEECRQETETLLNTEVLEFALEGLLEEYKDDYDQTCDFDLTPGSTNVGCRLKFSGDNATYTELCNEKGGKIYQRDVFLKCGFSIATYEHDLGQVPLCIGASCNTTQIQAGDINEPLIDDFVANLSFTGCKGAISAAAPTPTTAFQIPVATTTSSRWRLCAVSATLLLLFVGGHHMF